LALAGKIPAFIREVTERAKIAAIGRIGGADIAGRVTESDLLGAADAMENHANMLKPKEDKDAAHTVLIALPNNYEPKGVDVQISEEPQVTKAVNSYKQRKAA